MASFYKSPEVKNRVLELYDEKLRTLDLPYTTRDIPTSFGNTHVIVMGDSNKPPVVLLHGANAIAPIAIEAMRGLLEGFQIYAFDIPGQPNRSAETRIKMKTNDYGAWCNEVLMRLDLSNVTLVGASLGGMVILKTHLDDESRIKRSYLLMPAFIVNGNPFKAFWQIYRPMLRYQKKNDPAALDDFIDALFTEPDPFAPRFFDAVFGKFEMDTSWIPTIRRAETRTLTKPITVFGAENDLFFPGKKMQHKVNRTFPGRTEFQLLACKHVPGKRENEMIVQRILAEG